MSRSRIIFAYGLEIPEVEGVELLKFNSNRSMLDADIIVINPDLREFYTDGRYEGVPLMSKAASFEFRKRVPLWRREIAAALQHGKTVVCFINEKLERCYYTGKTETSGTGRNQKITDLVDFTSNHIFLPASFKDAQFANGRSMKLEPGSEVIQPIWGRFNHIMEYNCYYSVERARPLIRTKTGPHVVGSIMKENGALIIVPSIDFEKVGKYELNVEGEFVSDDNDDLVWSSNFRSFAFSLRDALFEIDNLLKSDNDVLPVPDWAASSEYRLKKEDEIENKITTISSRILELEKAKTLEEELLNQSGKARSLLFSKGLELEEAVREGLKKLGFEVEHYSDGNSEFDLIFISDEGRFLGEIEGKDNKPINIEKLSQLQRNLTEDFAREEIQNLAIGVLFGNGLRLKRPAERGLQFTEKVFTASSTFKIRLVTTSDLFYISRYVEESGDAEFARACRIALRDCVGGSVRFPDVPNILCQEGQIITDGAED